MQGRRLNRTVRRSRGFTLLEAIVALVLVGSTGMALMAWLNTGLSTVARLQDTALRNDALRNVLERMQTVNPMLAPTGASDFDFNSGGYRIRWKAEPLVETRDAVAFPFGLSPYQVALYKAHVVVESQSSMPWFELDLKLVGYKRVRFSTGSIFQKNPQ